MFLVCSRIHYPVRQLIQKAPIYVAPFSWTGFYVGINGGYGWGKSNQTGNGPDFSISPKGWLAGGTLGYNLQTGAWVWGLETDLDWSNSKGTLRCKQLHHLRVQKYVDRHLPRSHRLCA